MDNTRSFVTADQVRVWCAAPDARVTVRPVVDLAERIRVDAYQAPDRLTEQIRVRDGTCAFPWCARTARGCDLDHVVPYDSGGATASDNLAPLRLSHESRVCAEITRGRGRIRCGCEYPLWRCRSVDADASLGAGLAA